MGAWPGMWRLKKNLRSCSSAISQVLLLLAGLTSEAQRPSASLTLVLPTHNTIASVYGPNSSPLSCNAGTLNAEPLR